MKQDITNLFAFIDDFSKAVDLYMSHNLISENPKLHNPTRIPTMTDSEILTISLLYHKSPCKNFKYFYQSYLQLYKPEFPTLVSYERQFRIRALLFWMMRVVYLTALILHNQLRRLLYAQGSLQVIYVLYAQVPCGSLAR